MLPDQEIQLVEIILGQGRTAANLAYIHRFCAYDVLVEGRGALLPDWMCSPSWMGSQSLPGGWRTPTGISGSFSGCVENHLLH